MSFLLGAAQRTSFTIADDLDRRHKSDWSIIGIHWSGALSVEDFFSNFDTQSLMPLRLLEKSWFPLSALKCSRRLEIDSPLTTVIISKNTHPKDQTSDFELQLLPSITSGAAYNGVRPQSAVVVDWPKSLQSSESPKSTSKTLVP